MDINYETNLFFPIFSPVEHPVPPFPPQSMLKTPGTFLDVSPTLNKGERGILNSQILNFEFVSNYFVHDCLTEKYKIPPEKEPKIFLKNYCDLLSIASFKNILDKINEFLFSKRGCLVSEI